MRILVAPDCFSGTLSARQAADAMAAGWSRGAPRDEVSTLPLADGGPGFLETVHAARGGSLHTVTVRGPLGDPTPALVLTVDTPAGSVAYLESAQAVGLHLVPPDLRDPTLTTSYGLGELLRAALAMGPARLVVGLGGSATNDGGAGMLAALGVGGAVLMGGGGGLAAVTPQDVQALPGVRRSLSGVDLVVAADVDVPLLGLHGASAGFAAQKGATPEQAQQLERALGHFADVVARTSAGDGLRPDLLSGPPTARSSPAAATARASAQVPGAGAAGGLGFGLSVLGGRVLPGSRVVADAVSLGERVGRVDLVLTGEGCLDWQSLHGKVVSSVAEHGLAHGVPVVVVAGQVLIGRREWGAAGIAGAYALAEHADQVDAAMDRAAEVLEARVERVARTWSR